MIKKRKNYFSIHPNKKKRVRVFISWPKWCVRNCRIKGFDLGAPNDKMAIMFITSDAKGNIEIVGQLAK